MTEPKKFKARKFAAAVAAGQTLTQAALDAGASPASAHVRGSELIRTPEVQNELSRLLEEKRLSTSRALDELDAGLREGKKGLHSDYLDKLLRLHRHLGRGEQEAPQTNITVNVLATDNYEKLVDAYYNQKPR